MGPNSSHKAPKWKLVWFVSYLVGRSRMFAGRLLVLNVTYWHYLINWSGLFCFIWSTYFFKFESYQMRTYLKICSFLVLHFSHFLNVAILLQSFSSFNTFQKVLKIQWMNFVFLKFQYISKSLEKLVNELVSNHFIVVLLEFFKFFRFFLIFCFIF